MVVFLHTVSVVSPKSVKDFRGISSLRSGIPRFLDACKSQHELSLFYVEQRLKVRPKGTGIRYGETSSPDCARITT